MHKIKIRKSETADSRTCDWSKVSKDQLINSTNLHIRDVGAAIHFLRMKLVEIAIDHDKDKITDIDRFHDNFACGFEREDWLVDHYKINRHHLNNNVHDDVNLLDILEWISDCVTAGMARSGSFYPFNVPEGLLEKAFKNTVSLIKDNIEVEEK